MQPWNFQVSKLHYHNLCSSTTEMEPEGPNVTDVIYSAAAVQIAN